MWKGIFQIDKLKKYPLRKAVTDSNNINTPIILPAKYHYIGLF